MSIADTAADLLSQYGEPVAFHYDVPGEYDVETGSTTAASSIDLIGNGYLGSYKGLQIAGGTIQAGDGRLVCEKLSQRPQSGWQCTVDGEIWNVLSSQPIRKSAQDIIYICQLRK